jgi:Zn-dependent M28 family amino/carboxypeptidase
MLRFAAGISLYFSFIHSTMLLMNLFAKNLVIAFIIINISSCGDRSTSHSQQDTAKRTIVPVIVPAFNKDSAYHFVEKQVLFGPRVPNTQGHRACGDWLVETLGRFSDTLYVQNARVRAYDGTILNIRNIIGVFQPEKRNRILLCAHWDTRPWADHDPDPANHYKPFDGANDGASGVGVLLEIARLLSKDKPNVGIDVIFFDAEDYGQHQSEFGYEQDSWALGSQHWSRNPHRSDYFARYGILLDMVGASNATFKKEGFSMMYAPNVVRKVWSVGQRLGFGHYFLNAEGNHITDDHYYINTIRQIPTINIIDQRNEFGHGFFEYWHTMKDNMDIIDPYTLQAVGQTVITVLFEER